MYKNGKENDRIIYLWKRRACILRAIALKLKVNYDSPDVLLKKALVVSSKNTKLRLLLKALQKIRLELYEYFRSVFDYLFIKAENRYGKEGAALLKEKLLLCIDRCSIGKEVAFPRYFSFYVLNAFSEMDMERQRTFMDFTVPKGKRLLLKRIKRFFSEDELKNMDFDEIAQIMGENPTTIKELMYLDTYRLDYITELVEKDRAIRSEIEMEGNGAELYSELKSEKDTTRPRTINYWWEF